MRTNITKFFVSFLLLITLHASSSFSQGNLWVSVTRNSNVYITNDVLEVKKVYNKTTSQNSNDPTVYKIDPNPSPGAVSIIRYALINEDEDIIEILPLMKFVTTASDHFVRKRSKGEALPTGTDDPCNYYYKIVDDKTTPAKKFLQSQRLTGIPVTIPFKVRFNPYDGDDNAIFDANLAYGFGYKIRTNNNPYKDRFMRILLALGAGSQKYMPKDSVGSKTYEAGNKLALTTSVGATYEFADVFNIGAFVGLDFMFGANKNWYYQGKPWIGLGIGFKFD
jgi:hypothetical protein